MTIDLPERHESLNVVIPCSSTTFQYTSRQVFGSWSGHVTAEDGTRHHLDGIQGFAEESRSRW